MVEELNFFKIPIQLYYKNSTMHSHWSGFIGTICFTFVFIFVLIFFGMDFYLRENPSINIFKQDIEDFSSLFEKVEHNPKLIVALNKEIDKRIVMLFLNYKNYVEFLRPECSPEDLQGRVKDQAKVNNYYCFDLKSLQIEFDVRNQLIFTDCTRTDFAELPGYEQLDLSHCTPETEQDKVALFEYFVHFYYPQANLNMNDYYNPISYNYHTFTASFQKNKIIGSVLQSQFLDVNDDKGWIFKDESNNYGLSSTFYLESTTEIDQLFDYRVTLAFNISVETHKRIYTKIQNLAAEIGGFLKAILILARLPLDFICHHSMKSALIKDFMSNDNTNRLKNSVVIRNRNDVSSEEIVKFSRNSSETKVKNSELVTKKGKRKSITSKLIFLKIFKCCNKAPTQGQQTILKAERLVKEIFSVENIFKSYFEQDILKRMLLSEQDMKILNLIKRPSIYEPIDFISKRYFEESTQEERNLRNLDKEAVLATSSEPFEKVIRDYL